MVYFPPFLGGSLFLCLQIRALIPFAAFCLVSSSTYILNDILDCEHDRHHPDKQKRPLPDGLISVRSAWLLSILLLCAGVFAAWMVSPSFFAILSAYLCISTAYSLKLKEFAIVDIFCISSGFLLRLEAGGAAFNVPISEWLFLTVFLLSLFLSSGKRMSEKRRLGETASSHRKSLAAYPKGVLDGILYMSGSSVLVTYSMYAISRHSTLLIYSVPLCCFGLLRYIYRLHKGKGGDPTESLTRDVPLLIIGIVWVVMVGWGIYAP
jgi:4-hydroxybenzoate polyprenyltransferase